MHKKPAQQQAEFFQWFSKMGVHHFDIQIRTPIWQAGEKTWRWLNPIYNISVGYYFLKLSPWLKYMNVGGADIYMRPSRDGHHPVVFLDDLSVERATIVSRKYSSCVVLTSENNTQVWVGIDRKLSKAERKTAQSQLRDLGYTDPGSISGDHLGRLCGVKSYKRDCWVNLLTTSLEKKYSPKLTHLSPARKGQACVSLLSMRPSQNGSSQSERDFGWATGLLKSGKTKESVVRDLLDTAILRGKGNPLLYADRTVNKASLLL